MEAGRAAGSERGATGRRVRRSSARAMAGGVAALALLLSGCGGDGGMDGGDRPSSLVRVSVTEDTVVAGQALDDPLTVRVEDASGRPLPGVTVSFAVTAGSGSVDPDAATTGAEGRAETTFRAEDATGNSVVRASLPDASGVDPVEFDVRIVPPGIVRLRRDGGDGQEAEPGSQLPEAFRARTVSGAGEPTGGVRVVWSIVEAPAALGGDGARLTADTVFSDADGVARTLLTLAGAEGEHRVRAVAPEPADTIHFTATASAEAAGDIALDSVRPAPLRAGEGATLFGGGFGGDAASLEVTVEGVEAPVASAADGRLEIDVPSFEGRCLPARTVGVRVRDGERLSKGLAADLRPAGEPLSLAPGEVRELTTADEVRCLKLAAAGSDREYRLQVQSAAQTVTRTPMRLIARSGPASGTTPVLRVVGRRRAPAFSDRSLRALASRRELELKRNIRRELLRIGARPVRRDAGEGPGRVRASHRAAPPPVGDTVGVNFYVRGDLSLSCDVVQREVGAEVRAVGERVVLAEDTLAREVQGFDDADYAALRDEFDDAIFAVDSAYFGSPTDIDHNDRVIVLITPEVNMLTAEASNSIITGFFNSADLADSGDADGDGTTAGGTCSASNEGEILYLLAPDPGGRWGPDVSVEGARQAVRGTSAHEHQHLLNAGTRLIRESGGFGDLLATWLDEGLSHVAEEVVGMRLAGTAPRRNLTHDEAGGGTDDFDAYFLQNLLRLGIYHQNPSDTRTLSPSDPGDIESLELRGFAWSFLRWLADTRVPDGGDGFLGGPREESLYRAMARGGPELLTGTDAVLRAVEQVTGQRPAWRELVAAYSPVAQVDDDVQGVPVRYTFPSWNLRDVLPAVSQRTSRFDGYPLRVTEAGFESTAFEFELRGTTQIYFRLAAGGEAPPLSLQLSSLLGGPVPAGAVPQITVVRVR